MVRVVNETVFVQVIGTFTPPASVPHLNRHLQPQYREFIHSIAYISTNFIEDQFIFIVAEAAKLPHPFNRINTR